MRKQKNKIGLFVFFVVSQVIAFVVGLVQHPDLAVWISTGGWVITMVALIVLMYRALPRATNRRQKSRVIGTDTAAMQYNGPGSGKVWGKG